MKTTTTVPYSLHLLAVQENCTDIYTVKTVKSCHMTDNTMFPESTKCRKRSFNMGKELKVLQKALVQIELPAICLKTHIFMFD